MPEPASQCTEIESAKDYSLFGALLFIGIVVVAFFALRVIISARPRVLS